MARRLNSKKEKEKKRPRLELKEAPGSEGFIVRVPAHSVTAILTPETDFSQWGEGGAVLVGLHTCGDLGALSLKVFLQRPEVQSP